MSHLLYNVLPFPRRDIQIVRSDTSIAKCIALMTEKEIGALVVMDNNELIGIVSERDIIRNGLAEHPNLDEVKVLDLVFRNVSLMSEHDTVEKAMQIMTETKRRHILVKEHNKIVAIISIGDLMNHLLADELRVIQHLEKYIAG